MYFLHLPQIEVSSIYESTFIIALEILGVYKPLLIMYV